MNLDLRLPVGLMFSVFGALLLAVGIAGDPGIYRRSLGININLIWGLVLLAFGLAMLALAWRARRRAPPLESGEPRNGLLPTVDKPL